MRASTTRRLLLPLVAWSCALPTSGQESLSDGAAAAGSGSAPSKPSYLRRELPLSFQRSSGPSSPHTAVVALSPDGVPLRLFDDASSQRQLVHEHDFSQSEVDANSVGASSLAFRIDEALDTKDDGADDDDQDDGHDQLPVPLPGDPPRLPPNFTSVDAYLATLACPANSFGTSVKSGCLCRPGYRGTIASSQSEPFFTGSCVAALCPPNTIGTSLPAGDCRCKPGYAGNVTMSFTEPFFTGSCQPVECPKHTTGTNVAAGDCTCNAGFSGSVAAISVAPFYVSTCYPARCPRWTTGKLVPRGCICRPGWAGKVVATKVAPYWEGHCYPVPCPMNTTGRSLGFAGGCRCDAGYDGNIKPTQSWPFYNGTCAAVPCPPNSTGEDVPTGCRCRRGFDGNITSTTLPPFFMGFCVLHVVPPAREYEPDDREQIPNPAVKIIPPGAKCDEYQCPKHTVLKWNASRISCADKEDCSPDDRATCCDPKAVCSTYQCPETHLLKNPSVQFCAGTSCVDPVDTEKCCYPRASCNMTICPANMAPVPGNPLCAQGHCTQKDLFRCCAPRAFCTSYTCPPDQILGRNAIFTLCAGPACNDGDTATCCQSMGPPPASGPAICNTIICPYGSINNPNAWNVSCSGPICSPQDIPKCCIRQTPCTAFQCLTPLVYKPNPEVVLCESANCSDAVTETKTCCDVRANCSTYTCPVHYGTRAGSGQILCTGGTCVLEDTPLCCKLRAPCDSMQCPKGFARKAEEWLRCADEECKIEDVPTCCEFRAPCTSYRCPDSMVNRTVAVGVNGSNDTQGPPLCSSATCTDLEDLLTCCQPRPTCVQYRCPTGLAKKAGVDNVFCGGTSCSDGADTDRCCEPQATCRSAVCPVGQISVNESALCAGAKCLPADAAACCKPLATCLNMVCPGGRVKKDIGGYTTLYCQGLVCTDADVDICCQPLTTTRRWEGNSSSSSSSVPWALTSQPPPNTTTKPPPTWPPGLANDGVQFSLRVVGVNFPLLDQNPSLVLAFQTQVKRSIALEAGFGTGVEDVTLLLSDAGRGDGSVFVNATVAVANPAFSAKISSHLAALKGEDMASTIAQIQGIATVVIGGSAAVNSGVIQVVDITTPTAYHPPPMAYSTPVPNVRATQTGSNTTKATAGKLPNSNSPLITDDEPEVVVPGQKGNGAWRLASVTAWLSALPALVAVLPHLAG